MGIWANAGFVTYTLVFPSGATLTTDPLTGNPVPTPSGTLTLKVYLKEIRDVALRQSYGLDLEQRLLEGFCDDPAQLPPTLKPGAESPLTYAGMNGIFRLLPTRAHTRGDVASALGDRIHGIWRAV
jgi:hypothetical protein